MVGPASRICKVGKDTVRRAAAARGNEAKAMTDRKMTMGVIVGNRNFFPALLAKSGREEIIRVLADKGYDSVVLTPEDTRFGVVETFEDAKRCAALFKANRDRIDGVIVTLPNFGDERAIANTLRLADLGVPVLVQATPDTAGKLTIQYRRDSFCGKMSACNNLRQYGIAYSLTKLHTESVNSAGIRRRPRPVRRNLPRRQRAENLRVGSIGARPAAFNTVRFSEKILEANGISIETRRPLGNHGPHRQAEGRPCGSAPKTR